MPTHGRLDGGESAAQPAVHLPRGRLKALLGLALLTPALLGCLTLLGRKTGLLLERLLRRKWLLLRRSSHKSPPNQSLHYGTARS
ncbi:hypothetical protein GCM10010219_06660 [Streptomyces netropsis]|nr:hypothetical protein GCM10010219_06660 [Streptomyces netropsis]